MAPISKDDSAGSARKSPPAVALVLRDAPYRSGPLTSTPRPKKASVLSLPSATPCRWSRPSFALSSHLSAPKNLRGSPKVGSNEVRDSASVGLSGSDPHRPQGSKDGQGQVSVASASHLPASGVLSLPSQTPTQQGSIGNLSSSACTPSRVEGLPPSAPFVVRQ